MIFEAVQRAAMALTGVAVRDQSKEPQAAGISESEYNLKG